LTAFGLGRTIIGLHGTPQMRGCHIEAYRLAGGFSASLTTLNVSPFASVFRGSSEGAFSAISLQRANSKTYGTTVRTKLRLRNRFPNTAMEIFGRCGKMRVG
jgi:hypothetical protein